MFTHCYPSFEQSRVEFCCLGFYNSPEFHDSGPVADDEERISSKSSVSFKSILEGEKEKDEDWRFSTRCTRHWNNFLDDRISLLSWQKHFFYCLEECLIFCEEGMSINRGNQREIRSISEDLSISIVYLLQLSLLNGRGLGCSCLFILPCLG